MYTIILAFLVISMSAPAHAAIQDYAGTVRVHCIGDSITAGGGPSYRPVLHDLLTDDGFDIEFVGNFHRPQPELEGNFHSAIGGLKAWELREDYLSDWITANPAEIILLHIGTNGAYGPFNTSIADGVAEVGKVIDDIFLLDPEVELYVAGPINNQTARDDLYEFAELVGDEVSLRAAMGLDITFVDMSHLLAFYDYSDRAHPDESGYAKMGAAWHEAMTTAAIGTPPILPTPLPPAAVILLIGLAGLVPRGRRG